MKLLLSILVSASLLLSCGQKAAVPAASIIPKPNQMSVGKGSFEITSSTKLYIEKPELKPVLNFLSSKVETATGIKLEVVDAPDQARIQFKHNEAIAEEAYSLKVTSDGVTAVASNRKGFFYAIQTILQLLPVQISSPKKLNFSLLLPAVDIEDKPAFSYRGMHLDVSRHFFTVPEIKTYLDYLAMYKFNKFHWHLTDDQGWRLEIKKYPLLTEKGGFRTHNAHDEVCINNAKTDDTFIINPDLYTERDGKKVYGGFYTQEQIKEIIAYAAEREIEIIPEIDIPGHFEIATSNYPFLQCPIDMSEKAWNSYPACLGKKTTYSFIKDVLSEVAELFPSKYLHIGGDEVRMTAWKKCKLCQKEKRKFRLKDEHELQSHFNIEIEKFLKTKGKTMVGWDEIIDGGATKDAVISWWRGWVPKARDKALENGNDLIVTCTDAYYFDYGNDGTTVEKVYNYNPLPKNLKPEHRKQILGVQANLWSEWIPNMKRLQHQFFPRAGAIAENAWTEQSNKNWEDFQKRNAEELDRYDLMNIRYYIQEYQFKHKKVAFTDSYTFTIEPPMGIDMYYTTDGSEPNAQSAKYTKPIKVTETSTLTFKHHRGNIWGKSIKVLAEKQALKEPDLAKGTQQGVMAYYKKQKVEDMYALDLTNTKGKVYKSINIEPYLTKRATDFAMQFEGFLQVPADGVYDFVTQVDDSGVFKIGETMVVDRGGAYTSNEVHGMIALKKGIHKFSYKFAQFGGGLNLKLYYYSPSGEKTEIKESDLFIK